MKPTVRPEFQVDEKAFYHGSYTELAGLEVRVTGRLEMRTFWSLAHRLWICAPCYLVIAPQAANNEQVAVFPDELRKPVYEMQSNVRDIIDQWEKQDVNRTN
jgi:hypothetical protein